MTEGSFVSGATAVHERPLMKKAEAEEAPIVDVVVDRAMAFLDRRDTFMNELHTHARVLGEGPLLEKLARAYQWPQIAGAPTERLFANFAATDGWDVVLSAVSVVFSVRRSIAEREAVQAAEGTASRA